MANVKSRIFILSMIIIILISCGKDLNNGEKSEISMKVNLDSETLEIFSASNLIEKEIRLQNWNNVVPMISSFKEKIKTLSFDRTNSENVFNHNLIIKKLENIEKNINYNENNEIRLKYEQFQNSLMLFFNNLKENSDYLFGFFEMRIIEYKRQLSEKKAWDEGNEEYKKILSVWELIKREYLFFNDKEVKSVEVEIDQILSQLNFFIEEKEFDETINELNNLKDSLSKLIERF